MPNAKMGEGDEDLADATIRDFSYFTGCIFLLIVILLLVVCNNELLGCAHTSISLFSTIKVLAAVVDRKEYSSKCVTKIHTHVILG